MKGTDIPKQDNILPNFRPIQLIIQTYLYRSIQTTKVTKAYKNPSENAEEALPKDL